MATLWHPAPSDSPHAWEPVPLPPSGAFSLDPAELRCLSSAGMATGSRARWIAIGSELRVNGTPLSLGLRVLRNRDALTTTPDGSRFFFTDEEPARIESFPGLPGGKAGTCARCRTSIAPGDPAVRCPGCGAWCHQTEALPCWTYAGAVTCPLCSHPNLLNHFLWTPDEAGW